jgi:hypothetical protein
MVYRRRVYSAYHGCAGGLLLQELLLLVGVGAVEVRHDGHPDIHPLGGEGAVAVHQGGGVEEGDIAPVSREGG